MQLMLETVYAIKNNRDNTETKQERDKATKTRNLVSKTFGAAVTPLSITLQDIHNIETNGRWWVLGEEQTELHEPRAGDGGSEGAEDCREVAYEHGCAEVGGVLGV